MITAATRVYAALAVFAVAAGATYFFGSDYELTGTVLLVGLALVAATLSVALVVHRDFDPPATGGVEALAPSSVPTPSSVWPLVAALGAGLVVVGIIEGIELLGLGAALVAVALLEWAVQAWSEQISDDADHNAAVRSRVMFPFELPIGSAIVVAAFGIGVSRVLLAVSETSSVIVAGALSAVILVIGSIFALQSRIPGSVGGVVAGLGIVALLAGGAAGAVSGEREIHHGGEGGEGAHDTEMADEGHEGHEGSAPDVSFTVTAKNLAFDTESLEVAPGQEVTVTFENADEGIPHNFVVNAGGETYETDIETGAVTQELTFTIDVPGTYEFLCAVHPTTMHGEIVAN